VDCTVRIMGDIVRVYSGHELAARTVRMQSLPLSRLLTSVP